MDRREINVGIGEVKVARQPLCLTARGLGSCIGVSVYDPQRKLGGMAHIMLPDSSQFNQIDNPLKFADVGLVELLRLMKANNGGIDRLEIKLAGGAKMFNIAGSAGEDIGRKNIAAIKNLLHQMGLRIRAEHLGGNRGRTVSLDTGTGQLRIKVLGSEELVI